jgi:hypothetical protein
MEIALDPYIMIDLNGASRATIGIERRGSRSRLDGDALNGKGDKLLKSGIQFAIPW